VNAMYFFALIRRDPALRSLPRWLVLSTVTATALIGVITWAAVAGQTIPPQVYLALVWLVLAFYLAFGTAGARCHQFDLTLPIPSQRLWLAHLVALVLACLLLVAVVALALALTLVLIEGMSDERFPVPGKLFDPLLPLGAALALALALMQGLRPGLTRLANGALASLRLFAGLLFILALVIALDALSSMALLLPLGAALLFAAHVYRGLPPALSLDLPSPALDARRPASREEGKALAAGAGESGFDVGGTRGLAFHAFVSFTVYRSLAKKPVVLFFVFPLVLFFGSILGGGYAQFSESTGVRYTYILLTAYLLMGFLAGPLSRLHIVDTLPISRRRLFALLVLPALVAVALGYAGARISLGIAGETKELVDFPDCETRRCIRVPISSCEIAWDGAPPANEAPWGEAHEPWTVPLYRGSKVLLYSPFSAPADCTPEFFARQASRAIAAVYDGTVAPEEFRSRYLDPAAEPRIALRVEEARLRADFPDLRPRSKGPLFPVIFMQTSVIWLLAVAVYLRGARRIRREGARKVLLGGIMAVLLALHILQFVAFIGDYMSDWVMAGFLEIQVRHATAALPGGALAVWVLCGLLLGAAYQLALGQFRRLELPASREQTREC